MKFLLVSFFCHLFLGGMIWLYSDISPKSKPHNASFVNITYLKAPHQKELVEKITKPKKKPEKNQSSKKQKISQEKKSIEGKQTLANSTNADKNRDQQVSYNHLLPAEGIAFGTAGKGHNTADSKYHVNEYGTLTTQNKIEIDNPLHNFELPFLFKTSLLEKLYASIELKYDFKNKQWTIVILNGNDNLIKALLYQFVLNINNREILKNILLQLNKSNLTFTYEFKLNKNSNHNYDDKNIFLNGSHIKISESRNGGHRSLGNLPDKHVDKRNQRDKGEIKRLKKVKAYFMRIENEIIK